MNRCVDCGCSLEDYETHVFRSVEPLCALDAAMRQTAAGAEEGWLEGWLDDEPMDDETWEYVYDRLW